MTAMGITATSMTVMAMGMMVTGMGVTAHIQHLVLLGTKTLLVGLKNKVSINVHMWYKTYVKDTMKMTTNKKEMVAPKWTVSWHTAKENL